VIGQFAYCLRLTTLRFCMCHGLNGSVPEPPGYLATALLRCHFVASYVPEPLGRFYNKVVSPGLQ